MPIGRLLMRAAPVVNAPVVALTNSPRWGKFLGGSFANVTYTGRKSGRTVSLPVNYRRRGDDVVINVGMPDAKTWWRNFLGEGAPLRIMLDGRDRAGHAIARRDEQGRVAVKVRLEPE